MRSSRRRERVRTLETAALGVVSRAALRAAGIDDADVRAEVRAERWTTPGLQTVALHSRPLGHDERLWHAVWETGANVAALDGVTALLAAGMTGYRDDRIHLSVVHSHAVKRIPGVRVHKITRRHDRELEPHGIPRVRPAVAAIRAAHWADSDRQAALLLVLPTQQGLVRTADLLETARSIRGRRRRAFVGGVIRDIALGAQSLGELDFARLCRERGLPEPERQVVRQGLNGRIYLDVRWSCGVVVEIDGIQHTWGLAPVLDALRQNRVTLSRDTVLRIPNVGLRLHEDAFMEQVAQALRMRGGSR
jgi:very-short-patch-repair endonuclease